MLWCLVQFHPKQWDTFIARAEFSFNSMVNRSIGKTHFSIVYTKEPNAIIDVLILPKCSNQRATIVAIDFQIILNETRVALHDSNSQYKDNADQHRRLKQFEAGNLIMIRLRKERFPQGQYSKLSPRKVDPVVIQK